MKFIKYLVGAMVLTISSNSYAADCSSGIYKLYMDLQGNDNNSGSSATPLATLSGVKSKVESDQPDCEIQIHINKGTYYYQDVVWQYTNGHRITFTAANFGGQYDRPTFYGNINSGIWFDLRANDGAYSNVHFRYIKVQNYGGGIRILGNRDDKTNGWNGGNEVFGMIFQNIGGKWSPNYNNGKGYAAINTFNSRENRILNNHFVNIENDSNCSGCMHGVYLAHYSSDNLVAHNNFRFISGNPVQNRDESNNNRYENNRFHRTGYTAQVEDWYCTGSACTKPGGECPSHSVKFYNNSYTVLYDGTPQELVWNTYGNDNYCGTLPAKRLRTSGNTWDI